MYKYAELKYGKVVAVIEHVAALKEFRSFFDPTSYFIDVTGQNVEVGNVVSFNAETGLTFTDTKQKSLTLEETKELKISKLKLKRDNLEIEDIEADSMIFDYDDKSRERLRLAHEYIEEFNPNGTITWILSNNTSAELTLDNFKNIVKAVAERSSDLHYKYNILKEKVNNCTTNEEVEAIVWK